MEGGPRPGNPTQSTKEPAPAGLRVRHEYGDSLQIRYGDTELVRYVYRPREAALESPRPYFHPVRTVGGDEVSLYRPHDHVWHKGIAWSLPNVGTENFWGGTTYLRDHGYVQLANDGAMVHRDFPQLAADPARVGVTERLEWVTQAGQRWFDEYRRFEVTLSGRAWILGFATRFRNVSAAEVVIGSPTTQGRHNAGYGGLFWRGPRAFTGGTVYSPGGAGGDELMGTRAPWLGFCGEHDGHQRRSTLVFVDAPDNLRHPTQWFVRATPFACVCPAPFFSTELPMAPGATVALRYAVVVADGDPGPEGAARLAAAGRAALPELEPAP
jgi:hypothetical protein